MTNPEEPTRAVPGIPDPTPTPGATSAADGTQAVSRPPVDATQAIPTGGGSGGSAGGTPPTGGEGDDDESRRRRMFIIGGIVVVVIGVLAGIGIAVATQGDDSTTTSSSSSSTSSTSSSTSSTSSTSSSTTSSSTTSTTASTTTTTTTVPVPRIVSFIGPPSASCPGETVQLNWSTQNASGTTLSVDGGPATPGAATGATAAPFDCAGPSHSYTLTTTGGSPSATQTVNVQNNVAP